MYVIIDTLTMEPSATLVKLDILVIYAYIVSKNKKKSLKTQSKAIIVNVL